MQCMYWSAARNHLTESCSVCIAFFAAPSSAPVVNSSSYYLDPSGCSQQKNLTYGYIYYQVGTAANNISLLSVQKYAVEMDMMIRSSGRIFFSRVNFLCWLLFGVHSTLVLPQWHKNDPSHSAKTADGRLHVNTQYTLDPTKSVWADYAAVQA